jgi:hypothetical protein
MKISDRRYSGIHVRHSGSEAVPMTGGTRRSLYSFSTLRLVMATKAIGGDRSRRHAMIALGSIGL